MKREIDEEAKTETIANETTNLQRQEFVVTDLLGMAGDALANTHACGHNYSFGLHFQRMKLTTATETKATDWW